MVRSPAHLNRSSGRQLLTTALRPLFQVERHVLDINEGADTNTVIIGEKVLEDVVSQHSGCMEYAVANTEGRATFSSDVREPHELKTTGRIPSAVNIPITSHPDSFHIPADEFRLRFGFDRPALDKKLIVYCKAGVRSRAAKAMALDAGFEHVHDYPGSWLDWAKNTDDIQK